MIGDPSLLGRFLRRGGKEDRARSDPRFAPALRALEAELRAMGYTVTRSSLWRSRQYQEELHNRWEQGDPTIITEPAPPGRSSHQYGMAADLTLDPPDYDVLGEVAEDFGLVQPDPEGDPVHVELPNWRQLTRGWSERRMVPV